MTPPVVARGSCSVVVVVGRARGRRCGRAASQIDARAAHELGDELRARSARACRSPTARRRRRGRSGPTSSAASPTGRATREIRQAYVDKYGESILLAPETRGSASSCGSLPVLVLGWVPRASCSRSAASRASRTSHATEADEAPASSASPDRATSDGEPPTPTTARQLEDGARLPAAVARRPRAEHDSGGIDDESYAAAARRLHRARRGGDPRARDGVDATARRRAAVRRAPAAVDHRGRRRVRGRRRRGAGGSARRPAARADRHRATRGRDRRRRREGAAARDRRRSRRRSTPIPTTTDRGSSSAHAYEAERRPPQRARSSPTPRSSIDPNRPEAARQRGRLLYLASQSGRATATRRRSSSTRRSPGSTRRSQSIRNTPTPTSSGGIVLRSSRRQLAARAGRSPALPGAGARRPVAASARRCSRRSRGARSAVDHRRPRPPPTTKTYRERSRHGQATRVRDRRHQDLPRDDHHRPRHDRRWTSTRSSRRTP